MSAISIIFRGFLMGLADLVPGVSGGTLALILGVYRRFISALSEVDAQFFALLTQAKIAQAWKKTDANFLVCLFVGIGSSFLVFSHLIAWALAYQTSALFAFFFGLVLASLPWLLAQVSQWRWVTWMSLIIGAVIGVSVSVLLPMDLHWPIWALIPAGFIAISAMLLPGISGSFLLLLFGFYSLFIDALRTLDLIALGYFGLGAALGFLVFPKCIHALLLRAHDTTLAGLIGIVMGALIKLWPWHSQLGLAWPSLWPIEASGQSVTWVFVCMFTGLVAGILLTRYNTEENHGHQ
ncbi:MAG: DUF368 domain-containing protein [Pseudomonadota bacterium]|nr:DUF368 domain-containing protein [Pseudomonadota bacterium]